MDPELRSRFNADFTPDKYEALLRCVNESVRWPADFRISETPIFLTSEFTDEAVAAAKTIQAQTQSPEFVQHAASAIPAGLEVPNESPHPEFLIVDLGICDRRRPLGAAIDRIAGLSELVCVSIHDPRLHSEGVSSDPDELDVVLWRTARQ